MLPISLYRNESPALTKGEGKKCGAGLKLLQKRVRKSDSSDKQQVTKQNSILQRNKKRTNESYTEQKKVLRVLKFTECNIQC